MPAANICFPQQWMKCYYKTEEQSAYFTSLINNSAANSAAAESSSAFAAIGNVSPSYINFDITF